MAVANAALEAYLDKLRERFVNASVEYKQKYVRDTFASFDTDGGGTIDPQEFWRMCKRISPTMTDADVAEALEVIDEDGDGEITFAEFEKWWNGDYAAELREAHEQMLGSSEMDEIEMVERWEVCDCVRTRARRHPTGFFIQNLRAAVANRAKSATWKRRSCAEHSTASIRTAPAKSRNQSFGRSAAVWTRGSALTWSVRRGHSWTRILQVCRAFAHFFIPY